MANYNHKIRSLLKTRSGNFTQIPNEIFDANLSPKAKLIWIYLVSIQKDKDICQAYIGKKFNISKGPMKGIIQELVEKNLIEVTRKGPRSDYTVNQVPKELLPKTSDDLVSDDIEPESEPSTAQNDPSIGSKKAPYKYEHETLNTSERERSGKSKNISKKEKYKSSPASFKTTPKADSPESRLLIESNWYQWLINKHAKIQLHFPTLSYEERLRWATKYGIGCDKEQFLDEYLRHYNLIGGLLPETLDI